MRTLSEFCIFGTVRDEVGYGADGWGHEDVGVKCARCTGID